MIVAEICVLPTPARADWKWVFNSSRGQIERKAEVLPWQSPPPKRLKRRSPVYPTGLQGLVGSVTLQVTLETSGAVAECRAIQFATSGSGGRPRDAKTIAQTFAAAAEDAVRGWQYAGPLPREVTFKMAVVIRPPVADAMSGSSEEDLVLDGGHPKPRRLDNVRPEYPARAMENGVQGVVIVEATFGPDGSVVDARVLRHIPMLDQAALDAVVHWSVDRTSVVAVSERRNLVIPLTVNFYLPARDNGS